jgi:hypothetical protein
MGTMDLSTTDANDLAALIVAETINGKKAKPKRVAEAERKEAERKAEEDRKEAEARKREHDAEARVSEMLRRAKAKVRNGKIARMTFFTLVWLAIGIGMVVTIRNVEALKEARNTGNAAVTDTQSP